MKSSGLAGVPKFCLSLIDANKSRKIRYDLHVILLRQSVLNCRASNNMVGRMFHSSWRCLFIQPRSVLDGWSGYLLEERRADNENKVLRSGMAGMVG
jgi:hypothetical protein